MDQPLHEVRPAEDPYAAQRRAGFPWLRFGPELEREYRRNYVAINGRRIRISSLFGMFCIFGFVLLDQFLGMDLQDLKSDLILLGISVPAIMIPIAVTLRPRLGRRLLWMVFTGVLLVGLSIVAVVHYGRGEQNWFPGESLILVTAYVYFVSGLMFFQALGCGLLMWVSFVVSSWNVEPAGHLLYEAYYLALANLLGGLGLYFLQHQSRTSWLLQNELGRQAVLDSLTGLMNRRAFSAHLEAAWGQAQRTLAPIGVMLIDVDGFKQINDTCGHPFGDTALQHVAAQLRASVLRPLDAASRYGGDEFVALWYDVDGAWLQRLAQELPSRIETACSADCELKITVSGGAVVAWPRPGLSARTAIKEADRVLYEKKRGGRGSIGFVVLKAPEKQQAA